MADCCACKGIRSCNLCDPNHSNVSNDENETIYIYCDACRQAIRMDVYETKSQCPHHDEIGNSEIAFPVEGIFLVSDFLNENEENQLLKKIDEDIWIPSQSGRLKQDFGIKINFKKQTIKTKYFTGMPFYSFSLLQRIQTHRVLRDFQSVELCNLDYRPERGSHIDAHIDDIWIWGERLVTINLLSNTILTLIPNENSLKRKIYIPLPRRWLVVLYGDARYEYKHAIQRQHIQERRLAVTFRELTSKDEKFYDENKDLYEKILRIGKRFTGISVGRFEQLANQFQSMQIENSTETTNDLTFEESETTDLGRFLAQWRRKTRENPSKNIFDTNFWKKIFVKIVEEKKTSYPLLLSNLFTCQEQICLDGKDEAEKGLCWMTKSVSYYLLDLALALVPHWQNVEEMKILFRNYNEILPLNNDELTQLDAFFRLALIIEDSQMENEKALEFFSSNVFFLRNLFEKEE